MIAITKLNEQELYINCDLIEMIESTPDTTLTLTTGRKIIVKESAEKLLERITVYRKNIG